MKFTEIILIKKSKKDTRVTRDRCLIRDEKMVTRFGNPADAYRIYQEKVAKKEDVSWARGTLTENFKGVKRKNLVAMQVAQLQEMQERLKNELNVAFTVVEK